MEDRWTGLMPFWFSAYDISNTQLICGIHIVSWEPEGRYCRLCTAIAPFWFSTEHLWTAIAPVWLSTDDILIQRARIWWIWQLVHVQYSTNHCNINFWIASHCINHPHYLLFAQYSETLNQDWIPDTRGLPTIEKGTWFEYSRHDQCGMDRPPTERERRILSVPYHIPLATLSDTRPTCMLTNGQSTRVSHSHEGLLHVHALLPVSSRQHFRPLICLVSLLRSGGCRVWGWKPRSFWWKTLVGGWAMNHRLLKSDSLCPHVVLRLPLTHLHLFLIISIHFSHNHKQISSLMSISSITLWRFPQIGHLHISCTFLFHLFHFAQNDQCKIIHVRLVIFHSWWLLNASRPYVTFHSSNVFQMTFHCTAQNLITLILLLIIQRH